MGFAAAKVHTLQLCTYADNRYAAANWRVFTVICVGPVDNGNSGAEDDFKLIPSTMSPGKLAHEFEEYRPYDSISQFRREMAKYVSEDEVTYLTRYVTLD